MNTYLPSGRIERKNLFEFSKPKLYDLFYRGMRIVTGAAYPVCNGKKSELLKTNNYTKTYFEIKQHQ